LRKVSFLKRIFYISALNKKKKNSSIDLEMQTRRKLVRYPWENYKKVMKKVNLRATRKIDNLKTISID